MFMFLFSIKSNSKKQYYLQIAFDCFLLACHIIEKVKEIEWVEFTKEREKFTLEFFSLFLFKKLIILFL